MFKILFNNRGCWGGGGSSTPAQTPPPSPTPQPIAPSEVDSKKSEEERRQKLNRLRRGLTSTIKSGARGITGSGADLSQQMLSGRDRLG